jgi:hypothetical protein
MRPRLSLHDLEGSAQWTDVNVSRRRENVHKERDAPIGRRLVHEFEGVAILKLAFARSYEMITTDRSGSAEFSERGTGTNNRIRPSSQSTPPVIPSAADTPQHEAGDGHAQRSNKAKDSHDVDAARIRLTICRSAANAKRSPRA